MPASTQNGHRAGRDSPYPPRSPPRSTSPRPHPAGDSPRRSAPAADPRRKRQSSQRAISKEAIVFSCSRPKLRIFDAGIKKGRPVSRTAPLFVAPARRQARDITSRCWQLALLAATSFSVTTALSTALPVASSALSTELAAAVVSALASVSMVFSVLVALSGSVILARGEAEREDRNGQCNFLHDRSIPSNVPLSRH